MTSDGSVDIPENFEILSYAANIVEQEAGRELLVRISMTKLLREQSVEDFI